MNGFAIVEVFGHTRRPGLVSEVSMFGATMLRVEHPSAKFPGTDEPLYEVYGAAAIFAVKPCTREDVEREASWDWRDRVERTTPALRSGVFGEIMDDLDAVDVDDLTYQRAAEILVEHSEFVGEGGMGFYSASDLMRGTEAGRVAIEACYASAIGYADRAVVQDDDLLDLLGRARGLLLEMPF